MHTDEGGDTGEDTAGDMGGDTGGDTGGETDESGERRERVTAHPIPGSHNSLHRWYRHRNPVRVAIQYLVILVCRISPSLVLKRFLLRRIGVTVGEGVAWGLESTPDVFWPNLITVEDHAIIGYDATILCHEFLQDEYRTGEVVVRRGAMIGAGAVILPGVEIGEDAQVAANSLVDADVPPGKTVAGVPATLQYPGRDHDSGSGESGADDTGNDEQ